VLLCCTAKPGFRRALPSTDRRPSLRLHAHPPASMLSGRKDLNRDLKLMPDVLAQRKWVEDDFVPWGGPTGGLFEHPSYKEIQKLGWSFEPLGTEGSGFYFAPPNSSETIQMLQSLQLAAFIPASEFGGRKESYAFKCEGGKIGYFLDLQQSAAALRRGIALWQRFAWAAGATHERLSADSACAVVPLELIGKVAAYVPTLGRLDVYLRWKQGNAESWCGARDAHKTAAPPPPARTETIADTADELLYEEAARALPTRPIEAKLEEASSTTDKCCLC
jgi:hypothetical protein